MSPPRISVILPSYNYAEYLPEALESLAGQSFADWELVAADDGSTDGSLDILRRFWEQHPEKVRILTHPNGENRGLAKTVRLAADSCRGKIVAFLEADDVWLFETLSLYWAAFERRPDVVVAHGAARMFGESQIVQKCSNDYRWKGFPSSETTGRPYEALGFLEKGNVAMTFSSVAVRTDALLSLDWATPHDPWLDWWLLSQLAIRGKFFYEPVVVVRWRLHSKSYNIQYGSSIVDREKVAFAFRADIRRAMRAMLPGNAGEMDLERRRVVTKILNEVERSEKRIGSVAQRAVKRMLPASVKSVLKKLVR